jgi:phage I-like protein
MMMGDIAPVVGWVDTIQFDETGLWVSAKWTEKAVLHIEAGEYRYYSAVFRTDDNNNIIELINIGLTNEPRAVGIPDLTSFAKMMKAFFNGVQDNEVQGNEVQDNEVQGNEVQGNEVQGNDVQGNEVQGNEVQSNEVQSNEVRINSILQRMNNCDANAAQTLLQLASQLDSLLAQQAIDERISRAKMARKITPLEEAAYARELAKVNPVLFDKMIAAKHPVFPSPIDRNDLRQTHQPSDNEAKIYKLLGIGG